MSRNDLTFGFYENFPSQIHWLESFSSILSNRQLQQKLIQVIYEINRKEFSFEEIACPTIPEGKVIFEFGFADSEGFCYLDDVERKKALDFLIKENFDTLDLFCGIRYYKGKIGKKSPLRFDYYLLRTIYNKGTVEVQVHHEKGPRYISPRDLTQLISNKINDDSKKIVLKKRKTQ